MKTMLLPLTLLFALAGCAEDPRDAEISGLRGIIAQNDIDRAKVAEEMSIVREDYEQAKQARSECDEAANGLGMFALGYVKLAKLKSDEVYVCQEASTDANSGQPRSPWITTDANDPGCDVYFTVRLVYDAAGNPSFAPSED